MVPRYHSNLSPKLAETTDLIILEATVQSTDPRGTPCIEYPWSLRNEEQQLAVYDWQVYGLPTPNHIFEVLEFTPIWAFPRTLIETSGARGLELGSTNGRAEGSVPLWTSFPKRDPCSLNFLVSSRVSTPIKTAQPQMTVISEGRCPGTLLLHSPESNTTALWALDHADGRTQP